MALQCHNLVYCFVIFLAQWFVQGKSDSAAYTEFGQIEKLKQVCCGGVEAEDFRAEIIEENLAGEELQYEVDEVHRQRNCAVLKAFGCAGSRCHEKCALLESGSGEGGEEGGGDVGGGDGAEALEGDYYAPGAAHAAYCSFDAGEGAGGDEHALPLGKCGGDAVEVFQAGGPGAAYQYEHLHLGVGYDGERAVGIAVKAEGYGAGCLKGGGVGCVRADEHQPGHGGAFAHMAVSVGILGGHTDGGHIGFVDLRREVVAYLEHAVVVYVEC